MQQTVSLFSGEINGRCVFTTLSRFEKFSLFKAEQGGGQMLLCTGGRGWYQAWGEEAVPMTPGTVVHIPPGVKHWHGAAKDSWFSHLAIEIEGVNTGADWYDPVSEEEYQKLK